MEASTTLTKKTTPLPAFFVETGLRDNEMVLMQARRDGVIPYSAWRIQCQGPEEVDPRHDRCRFSHEFRRTSV